MKKINIFILIIGMILSLIIPSVSAVDIELGQPFNLVINEEGFFNDIDPENNPIRLQVILDEIIPAHEEGNINVQALIPERAKINVFVQTPNEIIDLTEFDLFPDGNRIHYEEGSVINLRVRQDFNDDLGFLEGPRYELHLLDINLDESYVKLRLDRIERGNPREPIENLLDDERNILPELLQNNEERERIETIRQNCPEIYAKYISDNFLTEKEKDLMEEEIKEKYPEFYSEFTKGKVGSTSALMENNQNFIQRLTLRIKEFITSIFQKQER